LVFRICYKKSVGRDLKRLGKAHARHILDEIGSKRAADADSHPVLEGPFAGMRNSVLATTVSSIASSIQIS